MRKGIVISGLVVLVGLGGSVRADYISSANKGNDAYRRKDYKAALDMYHAAETDIPESPELKYNIAGALYQQGGYEEAVQQYQGALKATDIGLEAQAQYNLGNTYYEMKDYQNAIKAYEESLKLNPKDMDAKYNLELARKMLKEQISPQNQQGKDQQNKDQQQNQQDQQNQNDQNQQDKQDQQDQDKQNQDKQNQQQQQQQQRAGQDKRMSKEDAERILNALRDDEQQIQKKVKREQVQRDYVGKDW